MIEWLKRPATSKDVKIVTWLIAAMLPVGIAIVVAQIAHLTCQ